MPFRGAIVLAAGKGTRMKSRLPKVLHKVGGKHMVEHVINAVREMGVQDVIVVIGHEAEMVREALGGTVNFAVQEQQLGTGHAVIIALPFIKENEGSVLIVCGDTPLIQADTLKKLWDAHLSSQTACTILSAELPDPTGYGRIIRNHDHTVAKVVEQKDAQPQELSVNEINTGTYCFDLKNLREVVKDLTQNNRQGEYYLTDAVALLVSRGLTVNAMVAEDPYETIGINSRSQLAEAEKVLRLRKINALMEEGVTIVDPDSTFIDQNVQIGEDTVIEPFTFLRGNTIIGSGCTVGPDTDIKDSSLGNRVTVTRTVMIESSIADGCIIGPFAYLRPGTKLEQNVKVGDFVEIKKSVIGPQSKVPHLSYIGDAEVGSHVNIGCGTITCNYDGKYKYRTIIGNHAFIGSNTNLVAPVKIGEGAMIGAGSTITKDVAENDLAIGRGKQVNLPRWALKKRKQQEENES